MGKNRDIESISNSVAITILHKIVIAFTNKPESVNKMTNEEIEYRGQSMKKIDRRKLNDEDKKMLKEKVIAKINNQLNFKYEDIKINKEIVEGIVNKEIESFLE